MSKGWRVDEKIFNHYDIKQFIAFYMLYIFSKITQNKIIQVIDVLKKKHSILVIFL